MANLVIIKIIITKGIKVKLKESIILLIMLCHKALFKTALITLKTTIKIPYKETKLLSLKAR